MKAILAFFLLLAAGLGAQPAPPLPRVSFGDSSHPVVYGEVWLISNGWGDYPGLLVGVIRDGNLALERDIEYPDCSSPGASCTLAVGVAEKVLPAPQSNEVATAYGMDATELSRRFSILYLSARIEEAERPEDWAPALIPMGRAEAGGVVLPRPERRTLRLLYPDGRPLSGARVRVALFGANNNHCGAAVGFPLAEAVSDAQGRITVTAPDGPLAVRVNYYEDQPDGPAGTAYAAHSDIVTGPERDITLKRIWTLAERDYALTVRKAGGEPLPGVRLSGCLWNPACGADCGPMGGSAEATDGSGVLRFRHQDLRSQRSLSLTDPGGRTMYLNPGELRELLSTGAASVTWREPPRPPAAPREP